MVFAPSPNGQPLRIRRSPHQELRLGLTQHRGAECVDVRTWVEDDGGVWHPTQRGLTVPLHAWPQFLEAALELDRQLCADGVLVGQEDGYRG